MPTTNIVVGPLSLANYLARDGELTPVEIEEDIRSNPDMYYSDYLALCEELGTQFFSEDGWRDLCRS